jgi:hypothetical protein
MLAEHIVLVIILTSRTDEVSRRQQWGRCSAHFLDMRNGVRERSLVYQDSLVESILVNFLSMVMIRGDELRFSRIGHCGKRVEEISRQAIQLPVSIVIETLSTVCG